MRGGYRKKVLRPRHSHLLLWWWASKPEGSLLGPSFRWPSYIWASYFTRTDSRQGPLGHSRGRYSVSLHGFQALRRAVRLLLFLRRNVANKWPGLTQRIWACTPHLSQWRYGRRGALWVCYCWDKCERNGSVQGCNDMLPGWLIIEVTNTAFAWQHQGLQSSLVAP